MIAVQQNVFDSFLRKQDEKIWNSVLSKLIPLIHPVDQIATQIWFSFWPLKLSQSLQRSADPALKAKEMLLDGRYRLEEQIDSSVAFLFGSRYWPHVRATLLAQAEACGGAEDLELERLIHGLAEAASTGAKAPVSVLMGISAIGCMILQQVGLAAFAVSVQNPAALPRNNSSAEDAARRRNNRSKHGLFGFLNSVNKRYAVTFDENGKGCAFEALHGQDLSMACATDQKDYRSGDHRRIEGPIPCQCRSGACGYCWIGVLSGKERLSQVTDFERKRLSYFGYSSTDSNGDTQPHIRLACQSKCYGDVSVVIPPWNGVLNGRT
jgi:ferredoxin